MAGGLSFPTRGPHRQKDGKIWGEEERGGLALSCPHTHMQACTTRAHVWTHAHPHILTHPRTHAQTHTHPHTHTLPPMHVHTGTLTHSDEHVDTQCPRPPPPRTSRPGSEPRPDQETSTWRWWPPVEAWEWEEWGRGEGFDRFGQKDKQKEPAGKRGGGTVRLWARGWRMWGERTRGARDRVQTGLGPHQMLLPLGSLCGCHGAGPRAGQKGGYRHSAGSPLGLRSAGTERHPSEETSQVSGLGPRGSREPSAHGCHTGTQIHSVLRQ